MRRTSAAGSQSRGPATTSDALSVAPAAAESPLLARLRDRLTAAGFDEEGVGRTIGRGALRGAALRAALHLRPDADEPLPALVRLLHAGLPVDTAVAARALEPVALEELERAGILTRAPHGVEALVRLEPFSGLLIASDLEPRGPLRLDHVLGVGPATRTLAALSVRRPVAAALDLGCGSGVHALLAARHAARVVGVDINSRALRLAELNAGLNGVSNVEWVEGDLFEPVRDLEFDLVVSNPPFVVSPDRELVYRDGGARGDALSRSILTGISPLLREGAFAHVLCSWLREPGDDPAERPSRWLEGSGCDVWILHFETDDPWTYAVRWNGVHSRDAAHTSAAVARWLTSYRELGVDGIATGAVILRRRDGHNWLRADDAPLGYRGAAGEHVARVFAAQDFLAARPPEALLDAVLAPAPDAALVERADARDGDFRPEHARLVLEAGIRLSGRFTLEAEPVVARLDGRRRVRDVLPNGGSTPAVLDAVRELLARGFLEVVGKDDHA
jgi:methylase of polypeptide subunit release factors